MATSEQGWEEWVVTQYGRVIHVERSKASAKRWADAERKATGAKGIRIKKRRVGFVATNRARHKRKKNPVRVAASMAGKSTGKIPAKWVKVTRGKGGVRVDIGR